MIPFGKLRTTNEISLSLYPIPVDVPSLYQRRQGLSIILLSMTRSLVDEEQRCLFTVLNFDVGNR